MKPLQDYTDDELREELKRRATERRKNTPREIIYVEFEATIKEIDNIFTRNYYGKGLHKYKPFSLWKYIIEDWTLACPNANQILNGRRLELKQGLFKRNDSPQIGDRVKLRYRRTKGHESFDIWKTKIVEIVKRNKVE